MRMKIDAMAKERLTEVEKRIVSFSGNIVKTFSFSMLNSQSCRMPSAVNGNLTSLRSLAMGILLGYRASRAIQNNSRYIVNH